MTRAVRLTRRQWMALPLEYKSRVGAAPAVIAISEGRQLELPIQWVKTIAESDMPDEVALDLDAHRQ